MSALIIIKNSTFFVLIKFRWFLCRLGYNIKDLRKSICLVVNLRGVAIQDAILLNEFRLNFFQIRTEDHPGDFIKQRFLDAFGGCTLTMEVLLKVFTRITY